MIIEVTLLREYWISINAYKKYFQQGSTRTLELVNLLSKLIEKYNQSHLWRITSLSHVLSSDSHVR